MREGSKASHELTDGELLAATADIADAFDAFYCRHREAVLAYLAGRTPDTRTALDLLAEVFAAAYLRRRRFVPARGPARAWLFAIAADKAAHRHSRRASVARRKLGIKPRGYTENAIEQAKGRITATALLGGLPPAERAVVQARMADDLG